MDINYFDLSGGINQSTTKTELGSKSGKMYWADAKNVELYNNKGIIRQNGNRLFVELPNSEAITAMCEMEADNNYKLVITTISGKIYVCDGETERLTLINKTISGSDVNIVPFLRGVIISTESNVMFYLKNNNNFDIDEYTVKDLQNNPLIPTCICAFKGRVWCAKGSTLYYSALGSYRDFTTANDAGYINDFHTDTDDIKAIAAYKDYLAIYKKNKVFLLSGSSPEDFAIIPFADRGAYSKNSIVNVDNKQFFLSSGIYALEQVGELNQIRLGSEISLNIKNEFNNFDKLLMDKAFVVHYPAKHQVWYFIPYQDDENFHTILINDYLNYAWFKRVIPQNITCACLFMDKVVSADIDGKIYYEDNGNTFNGTNIEFMWKSPFLSLGNVFHRKLIDEFYFILDDIQDNNFRFSIYKDYDGEYKEDIEQIFSAHYSHLIWSGDSTPDTAQYCWNDGESAGPVWPITTDVMEKAEICDSNYSIQLCIEGNDVTHNCAIIGLQFREIYNDD